MEIIKPSEKYYLSYKEAIKEYKDNNVDTYKFDESDKDALFKKYSDYSKGINLPQGFVPSDTYWLVDNNTFIGEISIRHSLTDFLIEYGGHIGYAVRYSYWNKGYATKMLKFALEKAKQLGLEKVLITCNDDNYGSARVIEKNGGVLEDKIKNNIDGKEFITRRYWIEL